MSYAGRVADAESRTREIANHSEPKALNHVRRLSKEEKREVAHLTGTVYTVVDGGPTACTEGRDTWTRSDYAVKMPPAPVEVYNPSSNNSAGVQRIEDTVTQNAEYLRQEAKKRNAQERQEADRIAARGKR
jgi:hypothetical protein